VKLVRNESSSAWKPRPVMVHPPPRSVSGGPEITSACAELATAAATMVRRCLILMRNPPITWAGKETASPKAISLAQRPRTEPIEPKRATLPRHCLETGQISRRSEFGRAWWGRPGLHIRDTSLGDRAPALAAAVPRGPRRRDRPEAS